MKIKFRKIFLKFLILGFVFWIPCTSYATLYYADNSDFSCVTNSADKQGLIDATAWTYTSSYELLGYTREWQYEDVPGDNTQYVTSHSFNGCVVYVFRDTTNLQHYYGICQTYWADKSCFLDSPLPPDSDGDGIPDNYDIAPNSPDNPQWKMISQTKNIATGEIVSALIQTDSGEYIRFGEKPEDMTGFQDYLSIGSQFKDNSELQETLEAGSYQGLTSSTQTSEQVMSELNSSSLAVNNASIPDVPDDFQNQGETVSDTSQTDTTTLQSTQNNTAQIVTNTAQTGAYLKAINDNLKTLNTLTTVGAGQGLSKNDIKSGVTDALNDDSVDVPDNSSVSDAMTTAQDIIKGDASLADDAPDGYKTKTDIVAKMADYISNNPLTNIITGSQIQCSGAVSHIESNLYGHSISFDLAPYSSQLQVFGQMLLAITTLAGMLLIFRK